MSADKRDIIQKMRDCENDPMWADHSEVPKLWCKQAADEIGWLRGDKDGLRAENKLLCEKLEGAQMEVERLLARLTAGDLDTARAIGVPVEMLAGPAPNPADPTTLALVQPLIERAAREPSRRSRSRARAACASSLYPSSSLPGRATLKTGRERGPTYATPGHAL